MNTSSTAVTITITSVTITALLALLRWILYPRLPQVLAGPLRTVMPSLSPEQVAQLDYPPDMFPGARDVLTPYGSIRVYEFGPVTGRKVLLVHGISTSCMTLGPLAQGLVDHAGCRVMLFDLFGRGYSDGVGDLPHDARLYTTQMLMALASSPLAWTGRGAFDLLAYSMGGGVAVHFSVAFSHMLRSLVLLAPAGLIRPERFGVAARLVFRSGIVPDRLLTAITRRRLRHPIGKGVKAAALEEVTKPIDLAVTETAPETADTVESAPSAKPPQPFLPSAPPPPEAYGAELCVKVKHCVWWMLSAHAGFVPAFMSCIRDAPLIGQHAAWTALSRLVHGSPDSKGTDCLPLCIVLGETDNVVNAQDYTVDALPLLAGPGSLTWTMVPGGHEFPMTYSRYVLRVVFGFWGGMETELASVQAAEDEAGGR